MFGVTPKLKDSPNERSFAASSVYHMAFWYSCASIKPG